MAVPRPQGSGRSKSREPTQQHQRVEEPASGSLQSHASPKAQLTKPSPEPSGNIMIEQNSSPLRPRKALARRASKEAEEDAGLPPPRRAQGRLPSGGSPSHSAEQRALVLPPVEPRQAQRQGVESEEDCNLEADEGEEATEQYTGSHSRDNSVLVKESLRKKVQ